MTNDLHVTASAMAAFDAIQGVFVALVKKGVLSKADAEAILREATEAVKTRDTGHLAAPLKDDSSSAPQDQHNLT